MPAGKQADELMTAEEVAAVLKLPSVTTLYDWRLKRKGPRSARVGRGLRYWRSEVDAWIAEQFAQRASD